MNKQHILLAFLVVLVVGCTKDVGQLIEEKKLPANIDPCDLADHTYSTGIKPIIDTYCATAGCHVSGGSAPTDYATYSGVMVSVNFGTVFKNRVLEIKDMPPTTTLTATQLQQIECWLNAGSPNN